MLIVPPNLQPALTLAGYRVCTEGVWSSWTTLRFTTAGMTSGNFLNREAPQLECKVWGFRQFRQYQLTVLTLFLLAHQKPPLFKQSI